MGFNYLFWCEFPDSVDWKKLDGFFAKHDFTAPFGVACKSPKEYSAIERKVKSFDHLELLWAWPTLPQEEGYWFSTFTSEKAIDVLDQYDGMRIKIDIEPPKLACPYQNNMLKLFWWLMSHGMKKGEQADYLEKKLLDFEGEVMLSTFSLPHFMLRNLGVVFDKQFHYNFIHYSSFIPKGLRWAYNGLFSSFAKKRLAFDPETSFAVGLLTPGIFEDEPCYQKPKELERDLRLMKKLKVRNVVVFRLGSFLELDNAEEWLAVLKKY